MNRNDSSLDCKERCLNHQDMSLNCNDSRPPGPRPPAATAPAPRSSARRPRRPGGLPRDGLSSFSWCFLLYSFFSHLFFLFILREPFTGIVGTAAVGKPSFTVKTNVVSCFPTVLNGPSMFSHGLPRFSHNHGPEFLTNCKGKAHTGTLLLLPAKGMFKSPPLHYQTYYYSCYHYYYTNVISRPLRRPSREGRSSCDY